jgi:cyclophilin family peptidyl-prolyl cis-trans isomerase
MRMNQRAIHRRLSIAVEPLEGRLLLSGETGFDIANEVADNRGQVTLTFNQALDGNVFNAHEAQSYLIFTAGPSGNPGNPDHVAQPVTVVYNSSQSQGPGATGLAPQVQITANLAPGTPYEVVVKAASVGSATGLTLDGHFNGVDVPSGNGNIATNSDNFKFVTATAPSSNKVAIFQLTGGAFGFFNVQLQPKSSLPHTIKNFSKYVNAGDYDGTFFHRLTTVSADGIGIIQGGGFKLDTTNSTNTFTPVPTFNSGIPLETGIPNAQYTISMARLGEPSDDSIPNDPTYLNSATSQFFFNLVDNSSSLLDQGDSSSYTAFGKVGQNSVSEAEFSAFATDPEVDLSTVANNGALTNVPINGLVGDQAPASVLSNATADLLIISRASIKMAISPQVNTLTPSAVAAPQAVVAALFSDTAIASSSSSGSGGGDASSLVLGSSDPLPDDLAG